MSAPRTAGWRFVVFAALSMIVVVRPSFSQTCDAPFMTGSSDDPTGGTEPREVAVADFNHDGFLDLAVQEVTSDTVSIMRGSAGGFSLLTTLSFTSTADVVAADFDHNGWVDVVVSAVDNNEVAIARGTPGGFLPEDTFGVGKSPTALATGDFDSDGQLDIAVYNEVDVTVTVLLGDGTGGFNPVIPDMPMTVGGEMAAGDLDRDGDLDLVATQEAADGIVVALGKNDGTFAAPTAIPGNGDGPVSLALADFNRDGVLDVVTDNSVSRDIEFYRGDGGGGFLPTPPLPAAITVAARMAIGDVDGNGALDVVLSDKGSTAIDVFLGFGSGSFAGPYTETAKSETFGIASGDYDRDGRDDIAVAYIATDSAGLMKSQAGIPCPNASFGRVGHYVDAASNPLSLATGDFDRDGNLDFVSGNSSDITRWLGRGIGRFQAPDTRGTGNHFSMDAADFDSDGDLDLVSASQISNVLTVYWNSLGAFTTDTPFPLASLPNQVVAADVSFDGKTDLIASVPNFVLVGLNDGGPAFFPSFGFVPVGPTPGPIAVGDFDNDFLADIAVGEESAKEVVLLRNNGGGSFTSVGSIPLAEAAVAIRAAHLNPDGNLDLVIAFGSPGTGVLATRTGNGAFGFSPGGSVSTVGIPGSPHGIAVADFDRDGNQDVAVADFNRFRVHVLPGNGSGGFGTPRVEPTPEQPLALAASDYDRDGAPDLLVALNMTTRVLYLPGNGGGSFSPGFFPAPSFDARAPATGDFDRDGRLDVVVANFDDDSVSPFLGFADGNFGPAGGPYSTLPGRGPVWVTVGDFDDDGEPDLLASAAGNGQLVFLGGGLGYPTTVPTSIGGNPSMSRAADFDFDGRLDIAVLNGNDVRIYRGNGAGGFITVAPMATLSIGGAGTGLAVGDFNRDGLIDVAATQTADDRFFLYFGNGPGSWNVTPLQLGPGRDPMDFDVADFDGNGFVDFAIPLKGDSAVTLVKHNGGSWDLQAGSFQAPKDPVSLRAPDINRDGKADLVVASQGDQVLAFFLGNGPGSFSTATWSTVGVRGPTGLAVGDFDADGAPDVAVVPDSAGFQTPPGFASVVNTHCDPRLFDFLSDVSTCDLPGTPFLSQPRLTVIDDGENVIQCEARQLLAGIVPGTGTAGAVLLGPAVILPSPSTGVYPYSNLAVSLPGGGYQLEFTHVEARRKLSRTFSQGLPVTITGPSAVCQGDPAFYSAEPGNDLYRWFVDTNPVSMAPAIDLSLFFTSNPGSHTIDVSVERDTCLASAFLDVDATPNLTSLDVAPLGPVSVCETCTGPVATATPTGGGATAVQWGYRLSLGGTINFFAGETNATYVIEGTDFPGPGTYYLVAQANPACGLDQDSNDVQIDVTTSTAERLVAFTALSTSGQNYLEWATPATPCTGVRILRRDDGVFPTDPGDPSAVWVSGADFSCVSNDKDSYPDTTGISNDTKYYYSAWVKNGASDSVRKTLKARPFDHTAGKVKWAYSTGATAMAQAGIRILGGASSVYIVSNDSLVHGIAGGPTGGQWLAFARPAPMTLPSQARPPVVPFLVGTIPNEAPSGAAFVASQDGNVYALDADDLGPVWTAPAAESLQAGAGGIFAGFGSSKDWILIGTKNTIGPNGFHGINVQNGNLDWFFDNTPAEGGDGTPMGFVLGGASVDYVGQRVFFGSWKGGGTSTVWALDISGATAVKAWSQDIGDVEASPVYLGGAKLVVGTKNGLVHLLDANNNGISMWTAPYDASDGPIKGFVFPHFHSGTTNYMFSTTTKVTSIRDNGPATTPTLNWFLPAATIPSPSVPIHLPGTTSALVGGGDGKLYVVNGVDTGTPTTAFVVLGDGLSGAGAPSFDVNHDLVYVGSEEGVIYAVEYPFP